MPRERGEVEVVGKRDLAQRLDSGHALQGLARLMLGQLGLRPNHAFGARGEIRDSNAPGVVELHQPHVMAARLDPTAFVH